MNIAAKPRYKKKVKLRLKMGGARGRFCFYELLRRRCCQGRRGVEVRRWICGDTMFTTTSPDFFPQFFYISGKGGGYIYYRNIQGDFLPVSFEENKIVLRISSETEIFSISLELVSIFHRIQDAYFNRVNQSMRMKFRTVQQNQILFRKLNPHASPSFGNLQQSHVGTQTFPGMKRW